MIRIVIADDHAVVREGVKRIIADAGNLTVVGEAADGQELLPMVERMQPDVVVMDLSMPGRPGLDILQEMRRANPHLAILILSIHPEDQYAIRALRAGASGYVNKGSAPSELINAIETVAGGRRYISVMAAEILAAHIDATSQQAPHQHLSNRELEVLCLMGSGNSVGDVARRLSLSVKTVSTYRRRILDKLGVRNNAEVIRYAIDNDLVT